MKQRHAFAPPPPSAAEQEAIRTVNRYLSRMANTAGTRLLSPWLPPEEAMFLDVLREQALAGAALCEGLIDWIEQFAHPNH